MVSPEVIPYSKVGGLADVAGSLSKAISALNHKVSVFSPLYGKLKPQSHWHKHPKPFDVHLGGFRTELVHLWEVKDPEHSITFFFIEHPLFSDRPEVYGTNQHSYPDNDKRFTLFCRSVIDILEQLNWTPDILHSHDWTTGLIPLYLNTLDAQKPISKAATVFTIHNLEHQGIFDKSMLSFTGLPDSVFQADCLESMGQANLLKAGLMNAVKITTVSPSYSEEIQKPEFGRGLNHALKYRSADLIGVVNGIDNTLWDPSKDPYLNHTFSAEDTSGKKLNKKALQKEFNLPQSDTSPLFGVVARMYYQKGLDYLTRVLPSMLEELDLQVVVVGNGESGLELAFEELAKRFPKKMGLHIGFDEGLSHRLFAGCDFFMMPSRFEPCGLTQMYAMRYGAVPVAHATGGLIDTIEPYTEGHDWGTGFLFQPLDEVRLSNFLHKAYALFRDNPNTYDKLQKRAMQKDFSWEQSAKHYEQVYNWAKNSRKQFLS